MLCNKVNLWIFLSVCEAVHDVALVMCGSTCSCCDVLGGVCAKVRAHVPSRTCGGGEDGAVVSVTSVGTGAALSGPTSQLVQNHRPCVC